MVLLLFWAEGSERIYSQGLLPSFEWLYAFRVLK